MASKDEIFWSFPGKFPGEEADALPTMLERMVAGGDLVMPSPDLAQRVKAVRGGSAAPQAAPPAPAPAQPASQPTAQVKTAPAPKPAATATPSEKSTAPAKKPAAPGSSQRLDPVATPEVIDQALNKVIAGSTNSGLLQAVADPSPLARNLSDMLPRIQPNLDPDDVDEGDEGEEEDEFAGLMRGGDDELPDTEVLEELVDEAVESIPGSDEAATPSEMDSLLAEAGADDFTADNPYDMGGGDDEGVDNLLGSILGSGEGEADDAPADGGFDFGSGDEEDLTSILQSASKKATEVRQKAEAAEPPKKATAPTPKPAPAAAKPAAADPGLLTDEGIEALLQSDGPGGAGESHASAPDDDSGGMDFDSLMGEMQEVRARAVSDPQLEAVDDAGNFNIDELFGTGDSAPADGGESLEDLISASGSGQAETEGHDQDNTLMMTRDEAGMAGAMTAKQESDDPFGDIGGEYVSAGSSSAGYAEPFSLNDDQVNSAMNELMRDVAKDMKADGKEFSPAFTKKLSEIELEEAGQMPDIQIVPNITGRITSFINKEERRKKTEELAADAKAKPEAPKTTAKTRVPTAPVKKGDTAAAGSAAAKLLESASQAMESTPKGGDKWGSPPPADSTTAPVAESSGDGDSGRRGRRRRTARRSKTELLARRPSTPEPEKEAAPAAKVEPVAASEKPGPRQPLQKDSKLDTRVAGMADKHTIILSRSELERAAKARVGVGEITPLKVAAGVAGVTLFVSAVVLAIWFYTMTGTL